MLEDARELPKGASPDILFEREEDTVVEAPEHEVPSGTMPESGQEPDDEHVPKLLSLSVAVAAERDVDIITEPGAERDVPTTPEIGDGDRGERIVEVLEVVEAEHAAHTDRHVTVGAEVEVELEREAEAAEPGTEHRDRRPRTEHGLQRGDDALDRSIGRRSCRAHREGTRLDELPDGTDGVREEDLLEEALQEAETAVDEAVEGDGARVQLLVDGGEADDRAGDELWEHRYVGEVVEVVFLDRDLALIEVDGVAHGLEGEETDVDRKTEVERRDGSTGEGIDRLYQEIGVLEETETAEVDEHRQQKTEPADGRTLIRAVHHTAERVVGQGLENHEQDVDRLAPGVEEQGKCEQDIVLPAERYQIVEDQAERQEVKKKRDTAENHSRLLSEIVVAVQARRGGAAFPKGEAPATAALGRRRCAK